MSIVLSCKVEGFDSVDKVKRDVASLFVVAAVVGIVCASDHGLVSVDMAK